MSRYRSIARFSWIPVAAAAVLAACASPPLARNDAAERASYMAHAGQPVDRFVWDTTYRRWSALSSDQVVVWTNLNEAYLVTVFHPCADLWFAHTIGFTHTGDAVYAHVDFVKADGWTCSIKTIQPVDYRGVERDLREASRSNSP